MHHRTILLIISFLSLRMSLFSQDADSVQQLPKKYLTTVSSKAEQLDQKLDKQSAKALQQMQKIEDKINQKLSKTNPAKATELAGNAEQQYKKLEEKLSNKASSLKQYLAPLDTLATSLKFLNQNSPLLSNLKDGKEQLQDAIGKVQGLKEQFQKAEEVRRFLKDRKEYLKNQVAHLGFAKEIKALNKQVYYYSQELAELKNTLKDKEKVERKVIGLLSKTKLYKDFMRSNSELASLFRLPGNSADPLSPTNLAGLQTRTQVNNLIQQQIAAGGPNAMAQVQQNLQQAQNQINELKNKIIQSGKGSSDAEMPEGFRPNNQKTKSFWDRLEYGTNIQSQKPNGYFPVQSDIGLSLGYKINDKSIIGIGASYKLGWGQNIRNIRLSSQGAGLRSFVDWKLKGSFWISGGYEMNYQTEFNRIDVLKDMNAWQQSGLIGLSKTASLKTKFFKKTKMMLLWDFLSYQQVPRTQPVVFRIGYNF